jgi:hypothetical protein
METISMTPVNRSAFEELCLVATGVFAVFWAILRASVQAITIDEADTYFWFVTRSVGYVFYPFSNNHVLNTLLMWMTTHAFGTSIISVRAPALLGAVLYVSTCYFLCQSITNQFSLRLPLFICLTYNPYICDFMVAARGYGLADAFLLAAIAVPVYYRVKGRPSLRTCCVVASFALGLSFAANFSFAFVDLATFLAILLWAIPRRGEESIARVVEFCVLPGLSAALILCGYPLAHWPKAAFWQSAHSLGEMTRSLAESSLYQLNPRFLEVELYALMDFLKPLLLPLLAALCSGQLVVTRLDGSWLRNERTRWLGKFAAAIAAIVTLSVLMSWLAFRFYNAPLPLGRTGIYLVPLCTLLAGIIAAAPVQSLVSRWLGRAITAAFICMACYFLLCLRLTYFKDYDFDADVKDVYPVLAHLNHTYGLTDVEINGFYVNSLNFYRLLSRKETFPEFTAFSGDPSAGKSIYVLPATYYRPFIDAGKLVVVYRGKSTDLVVAVRPDGPVPPLELK